MRFAGRLLTLGFVFSATLAFGLAALPSASRAADADADKPTYEVGLYMWGASLANKIDTERFDASSHIRFSDVLENLNIAVMGRARANFGKASVVFDGEYMYLESGHEQHTVNVGPGPGVDLTGSVQASLQGYFLELNTGYEVFDVNGPFAKGPSDSRGTRGEFYLGGRYYSMKPQIEIRGPFGKREPGEWESWVDGVVGARVFIDLSKTVVFGVQGDVGGFNIGNSSNLAWSQITSLSWDCTDSVTLAIGYKFLDFRKEDGDNSLEVQVRGPFLASIYRF